MINLPVRILQIINKVLLLSALFNPFNLLVK